MSDKVIITKSKIDNLAQTINNKAGTTGSKTINQMIDTVNNINLTEPIAPITWSQVNPVAAAYLAAANYDPADYSTSIIDNYANQSTAYRKDQPIGVTVQVSTGELLVVDAQGRRQKKSVTAGTETIYNLVPGAADYLVQQDGIIGSCGHLIPTGALRMIAAPSAINVRDLGGWACDGGTIKYGKLFRGGALSASARGVLVDYLGIAVDLDLRGATEAGITASPLGDDIEFVCPTNYAWYSLTNTATLTEVLRCIFDAVAIGKPLYFHCAAGADRTGTIACITELLLGVAQGDVDKDYELTSLAGSSYIRKRTYASSNNTAGANWQGLINEISALEGSTMRDKIVNWVYSLGFTAAEINAFRAAMIDGTPETVTPIVHTYTITNTLSNATSDTSEASVEQNKTYKAKISAAKGYVISDIQIKMGGTDITNQVWDGNETNLWRPVTLTLTKCVADNSCRAVINGQAYACTLTADAGYTLDRATVSIKMGGVDVSTYYKDGIIAIPKVTGDLEITVTAVASASPYTNQIAISTEEASDAIYNNGLGYKLSTRFNSSASEAALTSGTSPAWVTGMIPVKAGDVIRMKNCYIDPDGTAAVYGQAPGGLNCMYFTGNKSNLNRNLMGAWNTFSGDSNILAGDLQVDSAGNVIGFTLKSTSFTYTYIRLCLGGDAETAIITINEEIT